MEHIFLRIQHDHPIKVEKNRHSDLKRNLKATYIPKVFGQYLYELEDIYKALKNIQQNFNLKFRVTFSTTPLHVFRGQFRFLGDRTTFMTSGASLYTSDFRMSSHCKTDL